MPGDPPTPPRPAVRLRFTRAAWIWLGVSVVLAAVGWFKTINLLLLLGYILLALLGLNAWYAWRASGRLAARRLPAGPAFPGEPVAVSAEVWNPTDRPATAVVTDRSAANRSAWLFAPLPPRDARLISARWTFPVRGLHPIGPLAAEAGYPFGLVTATWELAPPGEVPVLPPVGAVDVERFRRWLVRGGAGDVHTRRPSRRPAPGQGDVRGLRPYRPGDSPREIHWKTSARRGQLLVREYDRAEPLDLVLVVDPWLPDGIYDKQAARRLEWALSLATSLGLAWSDTGSDLTLIVPGTPPEVRSGRGTPGFVRQAFALLAGLNGGPAVPVVPPGLARRGGRRTARVVVSPRPQSPLADAIRQAGLPCAAVDPSAEPTWFVPPPELAPTAP